MRLCVIDGRGGGLGKRLIEGLRTPVDQQDMIIGLALNQAAAQVMRCAGAKFVGVGEPAIQRTVPAVDVILASLNMVLPGSVWGESRLGLPMRFSAPQGESCSYRLTAPRSK